jgi:hypothetical protein
VVIAIWIRLSVGTFRGTRPRTLIAPAIATAHGIVLVLPLMGRPPYDRLGILFGFIAHLVWAVGFTLPSIAACGHALRSCRWVRFGICSRSTGSIGR